MNQAFKDDLIVREMISGFITELKVKVAAKKAYYKGDTIYGIDEESKKRCDWLNHMIQQYNAYGSIPELVKMAYTIREQGIRRASVTPVPNHARGQMIPMVVPDELSPYLNDLRRFVDAMTYKLHRNRHKGRWESLDVQESMTLLRKEVEELWLAIKGGNTVEIVLEAADVANFAMIVASISIDRGNGGGNEAA